MLNKLWPGKLVAFLLLIPSSSMGQSRKPSTGEPPAPSLRKLIGGDEERAKQFDEQIDAALKSDRWNGAIVRAEELVALRKRFGSEALRDGASGARSVCLSLWQVDDKATAVLMGRFYAGILGKRPGLANPMRTGEALHEAKQWLRSLTLEQVSGEVAALQRGSARPLVKDSGVPTGDTPRSTRPGATRPFDHPYDWAALVLVDDPD